ncbi:branched-chain amino acid transport system ATP-binding protein [Mumia flava]|uniref:Branched-chain amino acid transport system ATP-binding protein n=1 Tax=Mumia flava TaxID=1348852 RepID=A0A0B2BAW6_9ACTN|nr:ABC transporter ATP-binding protein [Mumia flava]PJJ53805.1 branched-chain amino acid transport system ATP-binding protein [Mumia flava]
MLEIRNLTTTYGPVKALDSVDITVERGAITAVLGANGAGKTSLLRTVSGLVRPAAGTVTLDGEDITSAPVESMVRRGMAHVPEGRGVIAELTVEENLRLGMMGAPTNGDASREAPVRTLKDAYGLFPALGDRSNQQAHTLSGGERQMLVIARALLAQPTLLLLDEPSLGLAPRIVAQIFDLVRGLVADSGLTVLLVEQNATSALSIAHTGIVLNLGRVVVTESAEALRRDETLRHSYLGF